MLLDVVFRFAKALVECPTFQTLEADLVRQLLEHVLSCITRMYVERLCPAIKEEESANDRAESLHRRDLDGRRRISPYPRLNVIAVFHAPLDILPRRFSGPLLVISQEAHKILKKIPRFLRIFREIKQFDFTLKNDFPGGKATTIRQSSSQMRSAWSWLGFPVI